MIHELKTDNSLFAEVVNGRKTCELRRDDRVPRFEAGHVLGLQAWDDGRDKPVPQERAYVTVTHVLRGPAFGVPAGYALLSVRPSVLGTELSFSRGKVYAPARGFEPPGTDGTALSLHDEGAERG